MCRIKLLIDNIPNIFGKKREKKKRRCDQRSGSCGGTWTSKSKSPGHRAEWQRRGRSHSFSPTKWSKLLPFSPLSSRPSLSFCHVWPLSSLPLIAPTHSLPLLIDYLLRGSPSLSPIFPLFHFVFPCSCDLPEAGACPCWGTLGKWRTRPTT